VSTSTPSVPACPLKLVPPDLNVNVVAARRHISITAATSSTLFGRRTASGVKR
jgi:hypothetical protein